MIGFTYEDREMQDVSSQSMQFLSVYLRDRQQSIALHFQVEFAAAARRQGFS